MDTRLTAILIVVVLLLGGIAVASADSCFQSSTSNLTGGTVLVGQGFSLPTKGHCKTFKGFIGNSASAVSGAVCGSDDNLSVRFNLSYANPTYFGPYAFTLNRASLTGSGYVAQPATTGTGAYYSFTIAKIQCPAVSVD